MNSIKLLLLTSFLISFSVNAETALTKENILGSWTVNFEANNPKGSGVNMGAAIDSTWTFKSDGGLTSTSVDHDPNTRMKNFTATLKFRIEDGKLIKQVAPGRSKEESCSAIEMDGANLLLKCKFLYYSLTKK